MERNKYTKRPCVEEIFRGERACKTAQIKQIGWLVLIEDIAFEEGQPQFLMCKSFVRLKLCKK